jgi:hypothetical protein
MMEDELVKIWQSSPNQERIKFEKSRLILELQSSLDTFHRKIKIRDSLEQIAIVLTSPVFAYYAYSIPFILTKIASVLIIIFGIFVFIRLRNVRKSKPGSFTGTYLEYLYKSKDYLEKQKSLLDNILYWYIFPAMALLFLFILGPGITGRLLKIMKFGAGNVVLGIIIYFLNKNAVKKQFIPRLRKIDEVIRVMESQ